MKQYVFTKSLGRTGRANIARKIYAEAVKTNGIIDKNTKVLLKILKDKKKKALFNKSVIPYAMATYKVSGVTFYYIMNKTEGYDCIFKTSPIDAGFVEYIRVLPGCKTAILYTQHCLDRYNQRVCDLKHTTYKDMMQAMIIENPIKGHLATDKEGGSQIVQRIDKGFLLGNLSSYDDRLIILNTFYDSEGYKDSDIKSRTRNFNIKKNQLTNAEINAYDNLSHQNIMGEISIEELEYQARIKGYI
jgi:hypothetical protein